MRSVGGVCEDSTTFEGAGAWATCSALTLLFAEAVCCNVFGCALGCGAIEIASAFTEESSLFKTGGSLYGAFSKVSCFKLCSFDSDVLALNRVLTGKFNAISFSLTINLGVSGFSAIDLAKTGSTDLRIGCRICFKCDALPS